MAPEEIKKLIQDIDKLKKPYHRLLYRVLRKTRPEIFFLLLEMKQDLISIH